MPTSNTLVIFYSRTGTTAKLAESIAQATGADVERLTDTVERQGALGFLRSIYDATFRRGTKLNPLRVDPTGYQLVIVGTPDWGRSVSAPVRSFLTTYKNRLPRVAFFLTDGDKEHDGVFADMATLVGRQPVARLGISQHDVLEGVYLNRVTDFVRSLPVLVPMAPVKATVPAEAHF